MSESLPHVKGGRFSEHHYRLDMSPERLTLFIGSWSIGTPYWCSWSWLVIADEAEIFIIVLPCVSSSGMVIEEIKHGIQQDVGVVSIKD